MVSYIHITSIETCSLQVLTQVLKTAPFGGFASETEIREESMKTRKNYNFAWPSSTVGYAT